MLKFICDKCCFPDIKVIDLIALSCQFLQCAVVVDQQQHLGVQEGVNEIKDREWIPTGFELKERKEEQVGVVGESLFYLAEGQVLNAVSLLDIHLIILCRRVRVSNVLDVKHSPKQLLDATVLCFFLLKVRHFNQLVLVHTN